MVIVFDQVLVHVNLENAKESRVLEEYMSKELQTGWNPQKHQTQPPAHKLLPPAAAWTCLGLLVHPAR